MLYDSVLLIESPIQILIVLTIALLLFGPKKLPEIGRQIGGALRELRKAAGDVSRSFSMDYEPDTPSYSSSSYDRTASYYTPPPAMDAPLDLTDYSIVGVTAPVEEAAPAAESQVADTHDSADLADYALLGSLGTTAAPQAQNANDGVSSNMNPDTGT